MGRVTGFHFLLPERSHASSLVAVSDGFRHGNFDHNDMCKQWEVVYPQLKGCAKLCFLPFSQCLAPDWAHGR